jgi:hypothetical protein
MQQIPFISNRFALQRFLGLSKEEIAENERLWREENDEYFGASDVDAAAQLRDAGITGSDISNDLDDTEGDEVATDDITAGGDETAVGADDTATEA